MPLGIERINPRKRPPNANITFITALPGQDHDVALDYLERVAAIVFPIMRDNGLAVMSLDEFPATVEFWGRNFNAGEVIQLVLKNPNTGAWLPFTFVQRVMIHELAHIKQMNHSRSFWSVNNKFSAQLQVLRTKGYTGEGFWSVGRTLLSERYTYDQPLAESDMPKSLCGGTYRSHEKRKSAQGVNGRAKKPKLTYTERQKRRKERKFGLSEGEKVGADGDTRNVLEKGKKSRAAPRIAQSARGRELRAAAALKRFEEQKVEKVKGEVKDVSGSSGSSGSEGAGDWDEDEKKVDVGGGKCLIPDACGSGTAGEYFDEGSINGKGKGREQQQQSQESSSEKSAKKPVVDLTSDDDSQAPPPNSKPPTSNPPPPDPRNLTPPPPLHSEAKAPPSKLPKTICTACSFANDPASTLCCVCANVLNPERMKDAWKCSCYGDLHYMNPGDAGVCGVCGGRGGRRG
ncbi:WLM-domain-containing protein [Tuber magnatum]|uniref:WLM-domain-containing protein n=1 Tax=Tuber magnatum TaxID=42249 RepID=A0A317SMQ9_9PEZI|nr:WLM-domain-containing protein [Tuber magnatum]